MNPAKLLDEIVGTLQRYAPLLIVHVLVLFWLSARVLDPAALPDGIWVDRLQPRINTALTAIGLSLELWYVLVALVLAYIAVFQWVRSIVAGIPVLRISVALRYTPDLLGHAAQTLRMRPSSREVSDRLNELVDVYTKEYRETNQEHPYQWQFDREATWRRYYGALLVVLISLVVWAVDGAQLARSPSDVWRMAALTALISVAVRVGTIRSTVNGHNQLGYWALREYLRRNPPDRPDPLSWIRYELVMAEAKYAKAMRRSPLILIWSLLDRLPEKPRRRLRNYIRPEIWRNDEDWDILASHLTTFEDEEHTPPQALRVDEYLDRFAALLECTGAGLCALAPAQSGLAPAVRGGGSGYSFAERRHGDFRLTIRLLRTEADGSCQIFVENYGDEKSIIADIGNHPIELAAQRQFPEDLHGVYELTSPDFDGQDWPSGSDKFERVAGDVTFSDRLPYRAGSTYLMRARLRNSTQAVIVFQCFDEQGSDRKLIAWRIIDVFQHREDVPDVPAWWNPRGWQTLITALRSERDQDHLR